MKNVYMMKYYIKHSMGCIPTKADLEKGCSVSGKCNMYQRICVDMEGVVLDLRASSPRIRQKWVLEVEWGGFL